MSLQIIYGRAGTGKSEYCYKEIIKNINEDKIIMITPEQFSFTAEKKLMDNIKTSSIINVEVITLSRMAYRVIKEIGGKTNNLTECGKAMLIYSILSNQKNNLKFLGKNDENIEIVSNLITELKKHSINVEQIKEEINNQDNNYLKNKLLDIYNIYEKYENHIKGKYIDESDLLTILAEKIDKTDMFKNSVIYIDEFSGFTIQEYEIIKKLMKIAKSVTITICTDKLDTKKNNETDIFYSNQITVNKLIDIAKKNEIKINEIYLKEKYRFKSDELKHLEENLYENIYKQYKDKINNIQLFLAKNQYSEIENVAKIIQKLIREEKYRYKDIAIITKNIGNYSNLARSIFDKYEIPIFIDENRDLNQNIIIQYVLSIIEVFVQNWSYEAIINYLKTGFFEIEQYEMFKFENYCLKWGIKHNKWKKEFLYGNQKENENVSRMEEIRQLIINPLVELKREIDINKSAENISKQIYLFLIKQGIEEKINKKVQELEEIEQIDLINEYISSLQNIIQILDDIVLVFKDENMNIDKYFQIFKIALKNKKLTKIPGTQDQVIMGDVDRSRSHKVKTIFVIGINDGIFPSVHKDEGFLNDEDREKLKANGIELAKGTLENLYEDNFNIYKTFSTAEEKLYLSYSSADMEGKSLRPSMLITKIKKIYTQIEEESDIIDNKTDVLNTYVTYENMINNISKLKNDEEIDAVWYYAYKYYKNSDKWKQRLNNDLKGLDYTNIPEKICEQNINKLYGNTLKTSISRLEKYRKCPFSYYLEYGLKIRKRDELKIQNIDTGTFIHEVIDEFFKEVSKENIDIKEITDEKIKVIVDNIINQKLLINKNYIFTSTPKYKSLVIRLKRIIKKSLKYIIESLIKSKFEIYGNEIEFGEKGKYKPIVIKLENGKNVEITGKIDRIDIAKCEDGRYIRIIDYKSSIRNIDLNEVYDGIQIQLLTYLDAICKEEDFLSAGILYFNIMEQSVKAKKMMQSDEIEEKIRSNFKMKGLILTDIKIVKLHDKYLEKGYSSLVPAYIDKDGNISEKLSNGVTREQFESLQKYMHTIIKQISSEILNGNIDLKPYYKNKKTPCKYCDYKNICNFNMGGCENNYRYIDNKSKQEILEEIKNNN